MDEEVSNCSYCAETDKYTCNQEDGSKECKPGWIGTECDTGIFTKYVNESEFGKA